jgi:hypothetical protein
MSLPSFYYCALSAWFNSGLDLAIDATVRNPNFRYELKI